MCDLELSSTYTYSLLTHAGGSTFADIYMNSGVRDGLSAAGWAGALYETPPRAGSGVQRPRQAAGGSDVYDCSV